MAVGDAGKHRDHLVVAFERMDVDDAAAGMRGAAGVADSLDAGFGEYVGKLLLGHPHRLDAEEPDQDAVDVGFAGGDADR